MPATINLHAAQNALRNDYVLPGSAVFVNFFAKNMNSVNIADETKAMDTQIIITSNDCNFASASRRAYVDSEPTTDNPNIPEKIIAFHSFV
ncbi:hypothetical protein [Undibacterium danionis]|uniref:Uncharacterized protein n=1 Tax=Undibacterium danionis TaxID=1812100 RepID=A0ABV6IFB4_9BURK